MPLKSQKFWMGALSLKMLGTIGINSSQQCFNHDAIKLGSPLQFSPAVPLAFWLQNGQTSGGGQIVPHFHFFGELQNSVRCRFESLYSEKSLKPKSTMLWKVDGALGYYAKDHDCYHLEKREFCSLGTGAQKRTPTSETWGGRIFNVQPWIRCLNSSRSCTLSISYGIALGSSWLSVHIVVDLAVSGP